jgi:uncharacterized protein (UPF0332 family)
MKKPDWIQWMNNKKECKYWLDYYFKKNIIIRSNDESGLHLRKTNHNLNFADWILELHKKEIPRFFKQETFYDWVISMYYYAVYHSALALISRHGFKSRAHSATICFLVYYNFHLKNHLEKQDIEFVASSLNIEDIETIGYSKALRERASYDVHASFEKELAGKIKEKSIRFINKIKSILGS